MTYNEILDINTFDNNFKLADKGTRLANHIVDSIGFYFLIFLHAMILDGYLGIIPKDGSPLLGIYAFVLYIFYHTLFEYFLGKTPGKFLTKTHVKTINGLRPSFAKVLKRNLCRLIPLDNISFLIFKHGWHDKISKTCVVYDN
jgi:uncharacterized RDD family membrane protein YckC